MSIFKVTIARLKYQPHVAILLSLCIGISFSIPISCVLIISDYQGKILKRASETPYVVGELGSKTDLVLSALTFLSTDLKSISIGQLKKSATDEEGIFIPMNLFYKVKNYSLVGTTNEYYKLRKLKPLYGKLPSLPGEVALGYTLADKLNISVGKKLTTEQREFYNLSEPQSVTLKVTGIIKKTNSPDDYVAFTPIETSWIASGHLHSHANIDIKDHEEIINDRVISEKNIKMLHAHSDKENFPITLAIFVPKNKKSATIVPSRIDQSRELHAPKPVSVITDLLLYVVRTRDLVLSIAGILIIACITLSFFIYTLDLRSRKKEFKTLKSIGISNSSIKLLIYTEIFLIIILSILVTMSITAILLKWTSTTNNLVF